MMTGWTEASWFTTIREQKAYATGWAPKPGEATSEIAAVEILVDDMAADGTPETALLFIALLPDTLEPFEVVLDQGRQVGGSRITGLADSFGRALPTGSNGRTVSVTNIMLGCLLK